ncbi:exopolyphosphatase [Ascoidea rubescens DSM 1968]|uniref:DHH phosphoesterase n=1 Tax=Ascoidea rubescens DSM 1968 TaxID=1344418 RepID=A0A1D2VCF6_9ASCO|nr:DHH phosphoesterase [Ascoidea rubescens DSM 1968]ODV59316.1 DHH phosphoesterase [Ascoidea rubescens DSM 1968]
MKDISRVNKLCAKAFLAECRSELIGLCQKIESGEEKKWIKKEMIITMGNQSADLDSIVSSLLFSFFFKKKNPGCTIIPLVSIRRREIELRQDVIYLMGTIGISKDELNYIDDKWIKTVRRFYNDDKDGGSKLKYVLVDHNEVEKNSENRNIEKKQVIGVIDHHAIKSEILKEYRERVERKEMNVLIIEENGSCSSLIMNYWYEIIFNSKPGERKEELMKWFKSKDIVLLGLSALLVDTMNLTYKAKEPDFRMMKIYEDTVNEINGTGEEGSVDIEDLFNQLKYEKGNLENLSIENILKKDFKEFHYTANKQEMRVGISSVPTSIGWVLENKCSNSERCLEEKIRRFMEQKQMDMMLVMAFFTNTQGQFERELVVVGSEDRVGQLEGSAGLVEELRLEQHTQHTHHSGCWRAYHQRNGKGSRKQVAPLVGRALCE